MSSFAAWVMVCSLVSTQADPAPPTPQAPPAVVETPKAPQAPQVQQDDEISRAIRDLGSDAFTKRQAATRRLLALGLKTKPALEQAAKSGDQETRQRASKILSDFTYGILPGVDRIVAERIRQFRDGSTSESSVAFQWLIERLELKQFQHLLKLQPSTQRTNLIRTLLANDQIIEQFESPQQVIAFINEIGEGLDESWVAQNQSQALFSIKLLKIWIATKQLETVAELAKKHPAATRTQFLYGLFQTPASLQALLENGDFDFLMSMVELIPDDAGRAQLLTRMTYDSKSVTILVKDGNWSKVLDYLEKSKDTNSFQRMLEALFRNTTAINHILEKEGLDALVELTKRSKDPQVRGRLLARLFASTTIQKHLAKEGNSKLALETAQQEKDVKARREYLKILLQSIRYRNDVPKTLVKSLWDLVKADDDVEWQLESIAYIVQSNLGAELLKSKEEMEWVVGLLGKSDAKSSSNVLRYLLQNSNNLKQVLRLGHFEAIWKIVQKTDPNLINYLFGSAELTTQLLSAKQLDRLVELPKAEKDLEIREKMLQAIFRNYTAMTKLIEQGNYDAFDKLISDFEQPTQAALFGAFLRGNGVTQHLIEKKKTEVLLRFAKDATPLNARNAYLPQLFTNHPGMTHLLTEGHFETLYGFVKNEKDEAIRLKLLSGFFGNTTVTERFVKDGKAGELLDFAGKLDANAQRTYLQRMFSNQKVMQALVKANRFRDVLGYIRGTTERYRRSSLFGSLISSSDSLRHLIQLDEFGELIDLAANDPDQYARRQMIYYLVGRSNNLPTLVRSKYFDRVLTLIQAQEGRTRSEMLVRMFSDTSALNYLVKSKRLRKVLDSGINDPTPDGRAYFLDRLFSNASSLDGMVKAGYFGELEGLAAASSITTAKRASYQGNLYTTASALKELIEQQRVRLLYELIINQPTEKLGSTVFARVIGNQTAVNALLDQGSLDELLRVSNAPDDPVERGRRGVALLQSAAVMKRLDGDEKLLANVIQEVINHDDASVRIQFLAALSGNVALVEQVLALNFYDKVIGLMEADANKSNRLSVYGRFLSNHLVLAHKKGEQLEKVFQLLAEETNHYSRNSVISQLSTSESFKWVVRRDRLDDLLTQIAREPNSSSRTWMYRTLLFSDTALKHLVAEKKTKVIADVLEEMADDGLRQQFVSTITQGTGLKYLGDKVLLDCLFQVFESLPETTRLTYVRSLVDSDQARMTLIATNQMDRLREAIQLLPESERASRVDAMMFSPTGYAPHLIRQGKLDEAIALAEAEATGDLTMTRLTALLTVSGRLGSRIQELQKVSKEQRKPAENRLLVYLLRAAGDLDGAMDLARTLNEPGFVKTLAVEQRDWKLAAKLQAEDPCKPPCPIPTASAAHAPYAEVEQLGLLASYQRLAGQQDDAEQTLDKIEKIYRDNEENATHVWHCAQAMLLNDRVDTALEMLAAHHKTRLFELLVYRQEYQRALEVVDFDIEKIESKLASTGAARVNDFSLLLRIGGVLESTGQREQAKKLYAKLEKFAGSLGNSSYPTESTLLMNMIYHHYRSGSVDDAWRLTDQLTNQNSYGSSIASRLFASTSAPYRGTAAIAWWTYLTQKDPSAAASMQLQRIERILSPARPQDDQWFRPLADGALEHFGKIPSNTAFAVGIGVSCETRGYTDAAEKAFRKAGDAGAYHLGRLLKKQERWGEAAELFQQVQPSHQTLISMYLAGDCLVKAGKSAEGEAMKQTSRLLAMSSRSRHQFAKDLFQHDFPEEALEQLKLVRRTAPPEHWEHNDAARYLGMKSVDDLARSAEHWQIYIHGNLRPNFFFNQNSSYLSIPHLIHKLRAMSAAQAGDWELAEAEAAKCHAATMGATALVEEIVPILKDKGQSALADAIFKPQFDHYVSLVKKHPESPLLNNNLAWLCARADRELELALKHAEKAVELSPRNAGHMDTLAEVHFRMGNAKKAVEIEEEAYEISPKANLKEQLERFRKALDATKADATK